ncbi:type I-E CRISPR-associated endoribonuclease Cas2e [Fundidesulfovibrio putealis]|uniref:type I-E CRISPR-associated endoribonuclease Cas2e n=1 Tax=Fundidesulfovibrio putealis TaxID=270496 RepID=UPI000481D3EA|nr:type I-E CRISPR-associated endoribonuclease Cas2e [Fundidesulfovibrio putealis]
MSMTVIITRNVAQRFRGFLASCMLEVASGVYTNPGMSVAVRERVWSVMEDWHSQRPEGSLVLIWADSKQPAGQGLLILGEPPRKVIEYDGVYLSHLT